MPKVIGGPGGACGAGIGGCGGGVVLCDEPPDEDEPADEAPAVLTRRVCIAGSMTAISAAMAL